MVSKADRERREEARKKRRQELELRIGRTSSGFDWLRRVERIGMDDPGTRISDKRSKGE
jgi:hypothetical protein